MSWEKSNQYEKETWCWGENFQTIQMRVICLFFKTLIKPPPPPPVKKICATLVKIHSNFTTTQREISVKKVQCNCIPLLFLAKVSCSYLIWSFFENVKPFNSQDLISNSSYCLPLGSYDASLENLTLTLTLTTRSPTTHRKKKLTKRDCWLPKFYLQKYLFQFILTDSLMDMSKQTFKVLKRIDGNLQR